MKTIMTTAAAIMALGLSGAAMAATDGTPGVTSTGSFTASVTLQNAPASTVSVIGLDDFNLAPVTLDNAGGSQSSEEDYTAFCVTRSDAGNVLFKVSQAYGNTSATGFLLLEGGGVDADGDGQTRLIGAELSVGPLSNPFETGLQLGVDVPLAPKAGCSAGPNASDHYLAIRRPVIQSGAKAGNYSGLFTVTVAPQ